jgi:methyl-accepting chemotaxis protein
MKDEIGKAISAHGMWKTRLKSAVDAGQSEFKVDTVKQDNQCDFGKWLYGTGIPAATKVTENYKRCKDLHAKFHLAAANVLFLAVTGKKAEAQKALAVGSDFAKISSELTRAMMEWQAKS